MYLLLSPYFFLFGKTEHYSYLTSSRQNAAQRSSSSPYKKPQNVFATMIWKTTRMMTMMTMMTKSRVPAAQQAPSL